jgi:hypothetical protein
MKDYLMQVVKNTCMVIAGVSILALYFIGLVFSVCFAMLPLFVAIYLNDCMGFDKWTVGIPGMIITIPWAVAWFTLLSKIDDKFRLGIF